MPTEFIPNQAVLFENPIGTYDCLNNDPRAYAQLAQPGDTLCVQWKMLPCTEDVSCEPDMVIDPLGADLLGAWSAGIFWTSSSSDTAIYDVTNNLFPAGVLTQNIVTTIGNVYKFSLTVNAFNGSADFEVSAAGNLLDTITQDGTYEYYFVAIAASTTITLEPLTENLGDYFELEQMSLVQYTDCWEDGLSSGTASWTYSYENGQGKFCSLNFNGGNLYNRDAYVTDGNYHKVTFTISGWSQGSVNVTLGGVSLGAATGEGTWVFYGTPTDVSKDLIFQKQDLFDGCISQVTVDDYGNLTTRYNAYLVDQSNNIAASMTPSYYDDRAVVCEDWNTIDPDMSGLDCDYFKFRILEECVDEVIDTYNSVNYFSYNLNGWDCSKVVEAWSEGYAFGFYFGTDIDNPDFKLYQRLRVLQFSPKYPNVGEEYLYSNGSTARSYAQTGKRRICWFDYIDENAHDTIRVQLLSQKLLIDNYAFYFPTADYEPEWAENGKYNLAQSRIELEHEQVLFGTTCGTQANSICPPQNIPVGPGSYTNVQMYQQLLHLGTVSNWVISQFTPSPTVLSIYGPYDLTNAGDRNTFLGNIISVIDTAYGSSCTGTITDIGGIYVEIDIQGSVSLSGNVLPIIVFPSDMSIPITDTDPPIAVTTLS